MPNYFENKSFVDQLLAFVCKDRTFLQKCASFLTATDFRPRRSQNLERWVVASIALEFWEKYHEPVRRLLPSELMDYAKKSNLSQKKLNELIEYANRVLKTRTIAAEAIEEKVISYKKEKLKADAVQELIDFQNKGQLTDEKWVEVCQTALEQFGQSRSIIVDPLDEEQVENRIARRNKFARTRYPMVMIDPIDQRVRVVSRGHIGMFLAPYKGMKSLGLLHIGLAYPMQALNVLYFTLEDPLTDVEDRFDAAITALPISRLKELPNRFRKKIGRIRELLRGRIRIIDGTDGTMSIRRVEEIYLEQRNVGFTADAIILDYDDEVAVKKRNDRKEELSDIYRTYGQFLRKHKLIGWIAAQTQRGTKNVKVIHGDFTADDISKMKKATAAIGIGKGDWGTDSKYLYMAVNRNDEDQIGWNIYTDKKRMLFYDRVRTMRRIKAEDDKKRKGGDDDE